MSLYLIDESTYLLLRDVQVCGFRGLLTEGHSSIRVLGVPELPKTLACSTCLSTCIVGSYHHAKTEILSQFTRDSCGSIRRGLMSALRWG